MNKKVLILLAQAVGFVALAAIVDIVYQYVTKPEISFYRVAGFGLVFGLGMFYYNWKKKK